jgi:hypothetical protein
MCFTNVLWVFRPAQLTSTQHLTALVVKNLRFSSCARRRSLRGLSRSLG